MNEAAPRVLELLTYIEQVEKLKTKPAFSVPTEYFVAHQHELRALPEVAFNQQADGDEVWLRLPRLRDIAPPDLGETLAPWVTLPATPNKNPELNAQRVIDGISEALAGRPDIQALFNWYIENQWQPWAAAERPRRQAITRYNQLFSLQQTIASEGAETPIELVWGIGLAAWKKSGVAATVNHPLIVQPCEVTLNEKTFELEVRPRDIDPRLEADCYTEMELPGVRQLDAYWKSALLSGAERPDPFDASTYEGTLKAAVGHLDPSGAYESWPADAAPPAPGDKLKITDNWVLFGRKRSGDIFLQDIRRLKERVEAAAELPAVIRSLVEHGDSTVRVQPEQPFRGLSSSDSPPGAFELYFPKPYNDEQVSIVQKLESNDGVVVQGPPGTGKTHTIANVICHYLAQGKRVLVTAKGESALAVLQDKLPERIRPLSVALLSDERDGMKQFEHSIETIASSVAALNPLRAAGAIEAAELKLNQLHAKIAHVDQTVAAFAAKHMSNYAFHGRDMSPEEMARLVMEDADEHAWFDDAPPAHKDQLPFDDSHITALRQARQRVGADLHYLSASLPAPEAFPAWPDLAGVHRDLLRSREIDAHVAQGSILRLVDSTAETLGHAQSLAAFLDERGGLAARIEGAGQAWTANLAKRLAAMPADDPLWRALQDVCDDVRALEGTRRELLASAVEAPASAELDEDFNDAIARLVAGKRAFALPFGHADARKLVAAVTIQGLAPTTAQDWDVVARMIAWRIQARKTLARWNALADEFGLASAGGDVDAGFKGVVLAQALVADVHRRVFEFDARLHGKIEQVFGKSVTEGAAVSRSLQAHLDKARLAYTLRHVQALLRNLEGRSGAIVREIDAFLAGSLGHNTDEASLQATWRALLAELTRVTGLQDAFDEIALVSASLVAAGAVEWAARVRTVPAPSGHDPIVPSTWLEAWNWRQAMQFLDRIDGHQKLRELFEERKALTTSLASTYQDLVAEKTWLGVYNNSPSSVRQALQAYLNSVQAMGAGTGVRAIRHRRTAREAMLQAYRAVPCWVLPHWRVSETLPPEIGLFDLVVIDEASQSDIWALPALLRGQKILVVGDHKQVSPSAVGTAEEKIKELSTRFLANQPHGAQMTPDKSIYDLARVVFAGNSVMLKEHFRCVPAIIEFSNREFYEGDIRALRLPKANERLDPPLVDVYVKGGCRKGDENPAEATAIVDEIAAILADEKLAGRTLGVVTLMGMAQAALIQEMVSRRIAPSDILARKIAVGPPPVFQGRERDVMLVSMVLGPDDRATPNRADMAQRYNVALSRARDRVYLFRSVTETTFKEDTLNSRLIRHFRQPFRQDSQEVRALREKCESGFEFDMFDELVRRGYRVQPQVPCGGYRIDFVVEGNEGRRLAIECDGDRFHGPGQWADDMARQRVLERAGWTFWRCFASSFVRRRDEVLDDLVQTLTRLGIEPLGAESVDSTVWVQTREVDPFGIAQTDQEIA